MDLDRGSRVGRDRRIVRHPVVRQRIVVVVAVVIRVAPIVVVAIPEVETRVRRVSAVEAPAIVGASATPVVASTAAVVIAAIGPDDQESLRQSARRRVKRISARHQQREPERRKDPDGTMQPHSH